MTDIIKTPAETFADNIGRKVLADAFGVGLTAVSKSIVRGRFPSSWFDSCSKMAASKGVPCTPDLFGQKVVRLKAVC
jgi:hypothetical protein